MYRRAADLIPWLLVGLLAFTLPFTSFPLVARLTGSAMVAPLALLPLGALLLVWMLPHLLRRGSLPPQARPLLAFIIVALLAAIAAFALPIPPNYTHTVAGRAGEALATLAVGASFYLLAAAWLARPERLAFFLRWLNWGGALLLAWALFQAAVWQAQRGYPEWLWALQGQFTTSGALFPQRVNGFAYEPSWLAHQLNMLYLPYWLAAVFSGYSAHRWRLGPVRLEWLLLAGGVAALVLSVSRVGWLAFLLMAAYLLLLLNLRFVRAVQAGLLRRFAASARWNVFLRRWFFLASLLALAVVYLALLAGAAYAMNRFDPRMARLFDFSTIREYSFVYYANQLVFAERIVFWQAGWEIFSDYPLLGVGPGNAGFFFGEKLSGFSWGLTEVRQLAYQWTALPNIKSLWVRLLAETGLVGFAVFLSWCYVLWQSARYLLARADRRSRALGLTGALALVGLLIEGFSVDTFALPYYWIAFGLLTAACELARRDPPGAEQ